MRRNTTRKMIMDIFKEEKQKLFDLLSSLKCRLSCTMDLWTSNQNKGYLCVTCHFIDDDWQIHKRIINFMNLGGRHSGANLSSVFVRNMITWNIDQKLFALTLDNASANEVCAKTIIASLEKIGSLICNGKFFHVRCAAHIINLIARDGLKIIGNALDNIRSTIMIVKSSPLQWKEFQKQASYLQLDTSKGLPHDVATRWNSTYLMLVDALYYKDVFQRLSFLHPEKYEGCAISSKEWEKASALSKCLKSFFIVTELFSGSSYPTANLFFVEFSEINLLLIDWLKDSDKFIVEMATAMKKKFDKYWEMSNMALAVACFLDPRYKKKVVKFYYENMCDDNGIVEIIEFEHLVKKLFDSYASRYKQLSVSAMQCSVGAPSGIVSCRRDIDLDDEPKRRKLSAFLKDITEEDYEKSELERYTTDSLLKWAEDEPFDILAWWKTQSTKYPILAQMARDVLAIPVSTVASESAFSAGGRVIDKYRSRLELEIVEALICTKDWINASRKGQVDVASVVKDLDYPELDDIIE